MNDIAKEKPINRISPLPEQSGIKKEQQEALSHER
jgi:hypothetical protein